MTLCEFFATSLDMRFGKFVKIIQCRAANNNSCQSSEKSIFRSCREPVPAIDRPCHTIPRRRPSPLLFQLTTMVRKRQFTSIPIIISIAVSCMRIYVSANGLRGSSSEKNGRIHCRFTVLDSLYLSDDGKDETRSETVCIPLFHGEEGYEIFPYTVELPDNILKDFEDKIEQGKLHVSISQAEFDGDSISIGGKSEFSVHVDHETRRLSHKPYNQTIGTRTLAVVTVSTSNGQHVSHSHETIETHLFSDDHSMARQYHHCSLGQLKWKFAGAYNAVIEGDVADYESPSHVRNVALENLVEDGIVERSAQELADNVMIILPKGTTGFIANAGMNYWLSTFNDVS